MFFQMKTEESMQELFLTMQNIEQLEKSSQILKVSILQEEH